MQPVGWGGRPDLKEDVGGQRVGPGDDRRALGGIRRVREAGRQSGSGLDRDLEAAALSGDLALAEEASGRLKERFFESAMRSKRFTASDEAPA